MSSAKSGSTSPFRWCKQNSMGYYSTLTILITTFLISTSVAQPSFTMWSLDLDDNMIILEFSNSSSLNPNNNQVPIDCTALILSSTFLNITCLNITFLNISMAMQLPPSVVGLQVNELRATCDLGMEFRATLNADSGIGTDLNNTFLYYIPSFALGGHDRILLVDSSNMTFCLEGTMATQIVRDNTSPAIAGFKLLDLDEGLIVLSFTESVNTTTFNFADLSVQNSPVNETTSMNVSLTGGSCMDGCESGHQITFNLIQEDLGQLKLQEAICVSISTCYPHHTNVLVKDFGENPIATYRFGLNYLLQRLIPDTTPPILVSCNIDLSADRLILVFDEPVDVGTFDPSSIALNAFQNSTEIIEDIILTNASSVRGPSGSVIVVDLGLDADRFKASTLGILGNGMYVSLSSSAFEDIAGNTVSPSGLLICDFISDVDPPSVLSFDLDLDSNSLLIRFSEPILLESLNISAFKLVESNFTTHVHMINLGDSFVYDSNGLLVNDLIMVISVAFGSQSLTRIKTSNEIGTAVNNTYLLIDDLSFVDTNDNSFISTGPIAAAAVIADDSPATAIAFSLDMNAGQITLTFNDVVDVSTWHNQETFIQRAAFTHNSKFGLSGVIISSNSNILLVNISNLISLKEQLYYGIAVDLNSTYLTIRAHAINDIRGVDIIAVTDGNGIIANEYIPDIESPQFLYFDLDMNNGRLRFYFDEPVVFDPSLLSLQGDSMTITSSSSVNISVSSTSQFCGRSCYYYIPSNILYVIRTDPNVARNANTTNLAIMAGSINDTSGNPINMVGLFSVRYYTPGRTAAVSFIQLPYLVNENDGEAQTLLILSSEVSFAVTLTVITIDGVATNDDYDVGPYIVTFPAQTTIVFLNIPIINDNIVESSEKFTLTFNQSSFPDGIFTGDVNQTTVTIANDDSAAITFSQSASSIEEDSGFIQLELFLSNPLSANITVELISADGTATGGIDYETGPYVLTIFSGMTSIAVNATIINDNILEENEIFYLTINSSSFPDDVTAGNPFQATVTILNDDFVAVTLSQSTYNVNEDDTLLQPTLIFSNPSSADITIEVLSTNGSAIGQGIDYYSGPYTAIMFAGMTTTTFDVTINNDQIFRGARTFQLSIDPSSLPSNVNIGDIGQATVTILDDDPAAYTVSFSQSTYSVNEGNGSVEVQLSLNNFTSTAVTISVLDMHGSTNGDDYMSGPYTVTFPAGMTNAVLNVLITNDDIFESNETFNLIIDVFSLPPNIAVGDINQATVTILNDDEPSYSVSFSQPTYNIDEGSGRVRPMLVFSRVLLTDVDIMVFTTDGSATGIRQDFESGRYTVMFNAGISSASFSIVIIDDQIVENDESFTLNIAPLPVNVVVGEYSQATVTILNDDIADLTFNQSTYITEESNGVVQFTLLLSIPLAFDINVQVLSINGLTSAADYTPGPYNIIISAGLTSVSHNILIIDDNVLEENEIFFLLINPISLPNGVTTSGDSQVTVTIVNDDVAIISFEQSSYTINQIDGWLQPVLTLSIPSSTTIIIRVFNIDGSADGNDYGSGPYTVTFPAGETTAFFVVSITNDNLLEGNEIFTLVLDPLFLPRGVTIGRFGEARVTITDSDSDSVLPFLSINRRQEIGPILNGISKRIYIPSGFPFGLKTHTIAYVETNGVISFSRPFYRYYPSPFPGYFFLRRFYIVAPYWADHDIRKDGHVCYETFNRGRSIRDDAVLGVVNHYISLNTDQYFSGTFMILAEWQDVHPYPHGSCYLCQFIRRYPSLKNFVNQRNTYQALVITDGKESYTVFIYMCDLMQWSGSWVYPTIGYNAGGMLFANHYLTGRSAANNIDCTQRNSQYNNVMYKISVDPSHCMAWYYSDIESYGSNENIAGFSSTQPPCPCTWQQARRDRRFRRFVNKKDSFCYIERLRNVHGGARECCYSWSSTMGNALVLQGRSSGGLLRYQPMWSPRINYPKYVENDRDPQEICCFPGVDYCKLYHERRPPQNCEGYVPQRRPRTFGDPHFNTIDGRRYTFNGLGEYVLLRANNFEFQGRTTLAANSNATIFSAFALREGNDHIEVGLDSVSESLVVKLSGIDVSDNLTSVGDNVTTSSSYVERSSNNSITASFPSGVGITISSTVGLLVYTLEVPTSFEGNTSGLLGNYNNDDSDEFVFRDGTMISNSSSDREIHQFGQSWQIIAGVPAIPATETTPAVPAIPGEGIFTYGLGESEATFSMPNHVPPFLDEVLPGLLQNMTLVEVCGDNAECLFDFSETGDIEVGMAMLAVENEATIESLSAFSFPPNITAPETFMATVGEESVYTFTVSSDSQNINVIILHEGEETLPSGVQLNNPDGDSYTITWTPADNTSVLNLTVVAVDPNLENISSIFNPFVQLCACVNGGNCTTDGLLDIYYRFVVLYCECPEGYDGELCQNDANGCEAISCLESQQCYDYPAPLVGAECGCPDGTVADVNNSRCLDINECEDDLVAVNCIQNCTNTFGSYQCTCFDGYQATDDPLRCIDINECEGYNDCHQNCINTEGSYYCSCNTGLSLAADNRNCAANTNCTVGNNCPQGCAVITGVERCFCFPGYQLDINTNDCLDVNECANTPCDHACNNTDGSFTCSCNSGYELDENGRSCNDIDECLSGPCSSDLICNNTDGNYSCDCPDGTVENGTDCIVNVTQPPLITTTPSLPPSPSSLPPSPSSLPPSPSTNPTVVQISDGQSTSTIVGITIGIFCSLIIVGTIVIVVAIRLFTKRYKIVRKQKVSPGSDQASLVEDTPSDHVQMEKLSTSD